MNTLVLKINVKTNRVLGISSVDLKKY